MPSRKRNKGKERKAKKEETEREEVRKLWQEWARGKAPSSRTVISCDHGRASIHPLLMIQPSNNNHPVSRFIDQFFLEIVQEKNQHRIKDLLQAHSQICNNDADRKLATDILIVIGVNNLLMYPDGRNAQTVAGLTSLIADLVLILENYTVDFDTTCLPRDVAKKLKGICNHNIRDSLKFFRKRISCKCLKDMHLQARETLPKLGGCQHCGKVYERKCLYVCGRCRISSYCSKECQIADSGLHRKECHKWQKHEECLVVKVKDGLPTKECSCTRCRAGLSNAEEIGNNVVSDFFMRLHMVRGVRGTLRKITAGREVSLIVI